MTDFSLYNGYNDKFIGGQMKVQLPQLKAAQLKDLAPVNGKAGKLINYINYSVALSASRRFPYFAASNINGKLWKKANRKNDWRRDERVAQTHQWGNELYQAAKSDFDKGHMAKREDVQWGKTIAMAQIAADSTFFFTNAVPQHGRLNQRIWRKLEDYILHKETKVHGQKRACVFTGPVLSKKDPKFITPVKEQKVQIPTLFWKVVVFAKSDGKLYRAGFIMSQESLLRDNDIIESIRNLTLESLDEEDSLYLEFEEADTYQTNISAIERLTGLTMPAAIDAFKDERSIKNVLREVDITGESLTIAADGTAVEDDTGLNFEIEGIQL